MVAEPFLTRKMSATLWMPTVNPSWKLRRQSKYGPPRKLYFNTLYWHPVLGTAHTCDTHTPFQYVRVGVNRPPSYIPPHDPPPPDMISSKGTLAPSRDPEELHHIRRSAPIAACASGFVSPVCGKTIMIETCFIFWLWTAADDALLSIPGYFSGKSPATRLSHNLFWGWVPLPDLCQGYR